MKSGLMSPPAVEGCSRAGLRSVAAGRLEGGRVCAPAILVYLDDQVRRVVGGHAGDHRGDLRVGALSDELELVVLVELLEDVRLELAIVGDRLDQLLSLVMGCGLHEIGDLGRVEVGELAVGEAQTRGRDMAHERLHVRPIQEGPIADQPPHGPRQSSPELGARGVVEPTTLHQ